tara:strand:- start:1668 stop:2102 length:435 start_codon:yes stop_codon:yes gene_type:complete
MATTRREHILDAVKTAITATTGISSRAYRSRVIPLAQRSQLPALLLTWTNDSAVQETSLATLNWTLEIQVACLVSGETPDEVADSIVEDMHSRLMDDITLGGYAMDLVPTGTTNESIDGDQPAGVVTSSYEIRYRTSNDDLSTV